MENNKQLTITARTAKELINLISPDTTEALVKKDNIDFHARKLQGRVFMNLLIMTQLMSTQNSQRKMSQTYSSRMFQSVMPQAGKCVSHCAISKRLQDCNPVFFKEVYSNLSGIYAPLLDKRGADGVVVDAVDSSLVRATAHFMTEYGVMSAGPAGRDGENRAHIKYSMIVNNVSAVYAKVHTLPKYLSEDIALSEAIKSYAATLPKGKLDNLHTIKEIFAFDRGLKGSSLIESIAQDGDAFVGRVSRNRHFRVVGPSGCRAGSLPQGVTILEDVIVNIPKPQKNAKREYFPTKFRLLKVDLGKEIGLRKGTKKNTERELWLITDVLDQDFSVAQLLEVYRERWKIEVFFRFLKQNLNLSHMVSLNENGLTIMLYVTLITALLLEIYCKINGCRGDNGKFRFQMELIDNVIEDSEELAKEMALEAYCMTVPPK